MLPRMCFCVLAWASLRSEALPQAIEFESSGLKYHTLTKNAVTLMFADLPTHVREYTILQVAVTNGSSVPYNIRPENFSFRRDDGSIISAAPAQAVVSSLIERGNRNDVVRL